MSSCGCCCKGGWIKERAGAALGETLKLLKVRAEVTKIGVARYKKPCLTLIVYFDLNLCLLNQQLTNEQS